MRWTPFAVAVAGDRDGPAEAPAHGGARHEVAARSVLRRRWVAVLSTAVLMVGFIVTTFVVAPVLNHFGWQTPIDFWDNYQAAHNLIVGGYAQVYSYAGIVTPPTILVVLLPIELLTRHLGLVTGFGVVPPRPSAWPVVAPLIVLLCSPALFAADSLAERLGADTARRVTGGVVGAFALGSLALWGHPEDAIAVACLLHATHTAADRRFGDSAWLLGVGMAFQPLIVLAVPVIVLAAGWRRLPALLARIAAPLALVLVVPAVADFPDTFRAVVEQPFFPVYSRPTLWMRFAPRLEIPYLRAPALAGGPSRLLAVAVALALGLWFMRRQRSAETLMWCVAIALALRYLFEAAVEPYYLWPPVAACLVLGAAGSWRRLALVCLLAAGTTCLANVGDRVEVLWWPTCAALAALVAAGRPQEAAGTTRVTVPWRTS